MGTGQLDGFCIVRIHPVILNLRRFRLPPARMVLGMLTVSFGIRHGLVLSLSDLRQVLDELSRERGRWWLEDPLVLRHEDGTDTVQVFHSLAGPDQVTDEISFLVPVIHSGDLMDESRVSVCLHPELIRPQIEGLYLEKGRVLMDFIEDWVRFWEPLKQAAAKFTDR